MKVGALAARGTCTRLNGAIVGGVGGVTTCEWVWDEEPPPGTVRVGCHVWCPPGFRAKENRGVGMLGVSGSHVHAPLLSGCRVPVKAGDLPACALCPAPQTIRGSVVLFGRGCIPKTEWLLPETEAALGLGGAIRGASQGQGQALRLSQRTSNKNPLPADLWDVTAAVSTGFLWQAQAEEQGTVSLWIPEKMDNYTRPHTHLHIRALKSH